MGLLTGAMLERARLQARRKTRIESCSFSR